MEHFYTIQGEGHHQGKAAYFIRLAGCDVGCVWCDVKESWKVEGHPTLTLEEIIAHVKKTPAKIAVITGGEPLLHPLNALTKGLQEEGIATHIETSASSPLTGSWNWICISPKKFKAPIPELLPMANELKVVIYHPSDLDWAETYASQVNSNCYLYLQPEWDKSSQMTPMIVAYIKQNPKWQLGLQIHKYIQVP